MMYSHFSGVNGGVNAITGSSPTSSASLSSASVNCKYSKDDGNKEFAAGPWIASVLAAAPPHVQKQMLGEALYPMVAKYQPDLAGKITGMMLEMDSSELLILLESQQE